MNYGFNDDIQRWVCYDCKIQFNDADELREHLEQSPKHNYCRQCDKTFVTINGLEEHKKRAVAHASTSSSINNNGTIPLVQVACPGCSRSYSRLSSMVSHMESGFCELEFLDPRTKKIIQLYMQKKHESRHFDPSLGIISDTEFQRCLFSITPPQLLIQAFKVPGSEFFNCIYHKCNFRTNCSSTFISHLRSSAHQESALGCVHCNKSFRLLSSLCTHLEYGCSPDKAKRSTNEGRRPKNQQQRTGAGKNNRRYKNSSQKEDSQKNRNGQRSNKGANLKSVTGFKNRHTKSA